MMGSISATAVYVESLPPPPQVVVARPVPHVHAGSEDQLVSSLAKRVEQIAAVNRQRLQVAASFCNIIILAVPCNAVLRRAVL